MKKWQFYSLFITLLVLVSMLSQNSMAKTNMGTITIEVGQDYTVDLGNQSLWSFTWTRTNGNAFSITSRGKSSCTIHGNSIGTATLNFSASGATEYYELYWTINVTYKGGGSGGGNPDTGYSDCWTSNGNYSISWFDNSKSEYHISTAKELAGIAYLVNNDYTTFEGKTIKLDADIDLGGKNWTTIGDGYNYDFMGAFDGQNHTISGIYIVSQHDKQQCYGFWGGLFNTSVKNVRLEGKVSIENSNALTVGYNQYNYPGHSFIGGLVGFAHNVLFENCKVDMEVVCKRNHTNGYIMLGGIAGMCRMNSSSNVTMRYCSHNGPLYASEWSGYSNPPTIGGLIGYSGLSYEPGILEYCENRSSEIFCSQPSGAHEKTTDLVVGGLVGRGKSKISYSRSIVDRINVINNSMNTVFFYIGGIGGGMQPTTNCYSIINQYNINSVTMYNNSGYAEIGGITSSKGSSSENFSNSDAVKSCSIKLKDSYDGSTSYSSSQMKTGGFLDELNLNKKIWEADESGYPCINKAHYFEGSILVTKITLNTSSSSLSVGDTQHLTTTIAPSNATNKTVTWASSNTSVATISSSGLVTAKAAGSTTITCKANDGSGVTATCSITVSSGIKIDATNFPDKNFRDYLFAQSYGSDGYLTDSEIKNVNWIDVDEKEISSLKGIELFTALTYLYCSSNQLTALDVSKNTALTTLYCYTNQLTALDVSKNAALTRLACSSNQLKALDVSKNTALTDLSCSSNQLTALDVSKNTALTDLSCSSNQLTALDVSKNTVLTYLSCYTNQLTALDVSKNSALTTLYCYTNQLKALDISKNTALTKLNCSSNRLTALDVSKNTALTTLSCVRNQLTALDVTKCINLTHLGCAGNQIKGSEMDKLIQSLPTNTTDKEYTFSVIYEDGEEGNVCTQEQVKTVKAKGWIPKAWNGKEWVDYDGSDEPIPVPDPIITDISKYTNIIYPEAATASPESETDLIVKMKNATNNSIMGFQFDLVLPTGVTVPKDEDGFYLIELSGDRTNSRKHTVATSLQSNGAIRVVCYSNNNNTFSGQDGTVLTVRLKVDKGVAVGEYPIYLRDVVMTTPTMSNYNVSAVVSKLTVEDYKKGDVNGDKTVNVVDVAGVVNLILGNNITGLNKKAADINGDNIVNVVDVAGVVNIILGQPANSRGILLAPSANKTSLYIDDIDLVPGETKEVKVNLNNPGDAFTGCQFDLYLPKGISIVEEDGYALVDIGSRSNSRKHTVSTSVQPDGAVRVVCYSNNNNTFSGEQGDILTVTLHVANNAVAGNYNLRIGNITLSRTDVTGLTLDDYSARVSIIPTGINNAWAESISNSPVHAVSGQRLKKPRKGINIIDGRKVIVK